MGEVGGQGKVVLQFLDGAVSLGRGHQEDLLGLPQLGLVLRLFLIVLPVMWNGEVGEMLERS